MTEYKPAPPEIMADLEAVIERHPRFHPIRERDVRIEVLMAWNESGDPVKHHGAPAVAVISIVKGEERATGGPDVRIKIDADRYSQRNQRAQQAVLAHELYHLRHRNAKGGSLGCDTYNRPIVRLIPDDWSITGFAEVAAWYGDDSAERRSYRTLGDVLGQGTLPLEETQS